MTRVSYRYRYQEQNEQILQTRRHIMADTIGKCECINISDKYKIDKVISDDIDELDFRIKRIEHDRKELEELGANPDGLLSIHDENKSKLKNLLLRVRNTPDCK